MRWRALLLAATAALPVFASPAQSSAAAAAPPPDAVHHVTLITGDVVTVEQLPGGRHTAEVRPGAGREGTRFYYQEVDGVLRITPADMVPYVADHVLDPRLFEVGELIDQGYDDERSKTLPLVLVRDQGARTSALPGLGDGTELGSVHGEAVAADKSRLADFWQSVEPSARTAGGSLRQGVRKIWLDGRVRASLDHSVPQVGAPEAWKAGFDGTGVEVAVLDTGVDLGHPDLAAKIAGTRNFTADPSVQDGFGHGTHVASIIAGLGTASGGRLRGVAPGARLLVGKVLSDEGYGTESQVIEGMEWAASSGAAVVNMSLGGGPTDGTDPLSVAVDTLTEQTGTLFVVAAGNDGDADYTVGSPGTATAALTVGAVDREDRLASFSSRGPRLDGGLKPDITAPGVDIVAARAAGTSLGSPVDDRYTALSGTSMATPHVAGAAAIVKQRHPDWTAGRIKDALVDAAKTVEGPTVYEQGGGRLDVARAVRQEVTATGVLDLGAHEAGGPAVVDGTVTYANAGRTPVRLTLTAALAEQGGAPAPAGGLTLGSPEVTVQPGATAQVAVRADLGALPDGRYGGYVTAVSGDGATTLHTTLGLSKRGPVHKVHFTAVDRDGKPSRVGVVTMFGASSLDDVFTYILDEQAGTTVEVPEGTYMTQAIFDPSSGPHPVDSLVVMPELKVTGDMDVVLDARTAVPVTITTPKPVVQAGVFTYFTYRTSGTRRIGQGAMDFPSVDRLAVTPTKPVSEGTFEFASRWQLGSPQVSARLTGSGESLPVLPLNRSPEVTDAHRWPLVYAGSGTPEELARVKARGRAVVVAPPDRGYWEDRIAAAGAAGAAAVIVVGEPDFPAWQAWSPIGDRYPLPAVVVANDVGQRLVREARGGHAVIELSGPPARQYLYDVMQVSSGNVPDHVVYAVTDANTTRIDTAYQESGGFGWAKEQRFGWRPWQDYSLDDQMEIQRVVRTPLERAEYVTAGDTQWQHVVKHLYSWEEMSGLRPGLTEPPRSYTGGKVAGERWFGPVVRPAVPAGVPGLVPTRNGDTLTIDVPEFTDSAGHYGYARTGDEADTTAARLYRDGTQVEERDEARGAFPAVPENAEYRLELSVKRSSEEWTHAVATDTAWTFRSAHTTRPEPLPLLQVDYDVPADLYGRVPKGAPVTLGFAVRSPAPGLTVKDLTAELSYDDGATWTRLPVRSAGGGRYTAVAGPAGARAGRQASLRVTASDTAGDQVRQTVVRAYELG
ncbi:S8 family peptidase [Microbispora sp. ATCC PTA-5024]|uniref:S8 family peptidase n=1 Tax=Microbispora sp. ATCC PTA-5024 TaxID=316330 RepID=UPI0003DBCACA|nr:S8 family peptidase [Microbispora sp. ATCC PTA-5024]ETK37064.1 hypothetical protein MPTA5024_05810 [Microbispora sp. ATCC PTA-5024]